MSSWAWTARMSPGTPSTGHIGRPHIATRRWTLCTSRVLSIRCSDGSATLLRWTASTIPPWIRSWAEQSRIFRNVAVVREGSHACREVLVGVDDSAGGYLALGWAAQEADRRGVALHVVHVLRPRPESSDPEDEALRSAHRMSRSNLDKLPATESGCGLVAVAEVAARPGSVASQAAQRTPAHVVIVPVRQDTNYPYNRREQEEERRTARSGQSAHRSSAEYVRLP